MEVGVSVCVVRLISTLFGCGGEGVSFIFELITGLHCVPASTYCTTSGGLDAESLACSFDLDNLRCGGEVDANWAGA